MISQINLYFLRIIFLKITKFQFQKIYLKKLFRIYFFFKRCNFVHEKKNIFYLKSFINNCSSGSFDISLYPRKKLDY